MRALAPDGVDVALDLVGTDEALETSIELVPDRDRVLTVAAFARAPELGIHLIGNGPGADPGLRGAATSAAQRPCACSQTAASTSPSSAPTPWTRSVTPTAPA